MVEPLVTAVEVGKYLKCHEKTVRNMAIEGRLPGIKIGASWRFKLSEVDAWVSAQLASAHHPLPEKGAVA